MHWNERDHGMTRPNFILIYTDDQRHDAMGCVNPELHTPHMDALASRGMRFTHGCVVHSLCTPSRGAVLTGRYGSRNGVTDLPGGADGARNPARLFPGERTFAHVLRDAGYRTGLVGKWHIADTPTDCGFDHVRCFHANGDYFDIAFEDESGAVLPTEGYVEAHNARFGTAFLEQATGGEEPFVLFYNTRVPHMTSRLTWDAAPESLARYRVEDLALPPNWQDDLSGKPTYLRTGRNRTQALRYGYDRPEAVRDHKRRCFASITDMDATLGSLFAAVDRLGLRENTYIMLMGDNGWFLADHGFTSKVLAYEESMRVPLLVAGPGIRPGVASRLALNIDIAPTLFELAGVPTPASLHGASLVPLLRGADPVHWRTSFLYEMVSCDTAGNPPLRALRTETLKYIETAGADGPFVELYDLADDPHELTNLAADPAHASRLAACARGLRCEADRIAAH